MIRSRGKIGVDISTNRQIRKMRFSIFGGGDDVEKKAICNNTPLYSRREK
jgi:hypothetical protein